MDYIMNANKKQKYFQVFLVAAISILLWSLFPAGTFAQNDEGTAATTGEDKTSGITMQAVSGKVAETIDSGGYTYALVGKDGAMMWVALPKSRIAVGDEITCQPGMVMNNFSSPSLNRAFKQIVFSMGITSTSGTAEPPAPEEAIVVPKIKEPKDWKDF